MEQVRIVVEMPEEEKPYMGGFKNVTNGLVYLHGFSQTDQLRRIHPIKCHRDVIIMIYWLKNTFYNIFCTKLILNLDPNLRL